METITSKDENSRNETGKNLDDKNDTITVIVIIKSKNHYRLFPQKIKLDEVRTMLLKNDHDNDNDPNIGSNCRFLYFSKNKAEIRPIDEPNLSLLEVVEKKNDGIHYLYTTRNAEFDLTQLGVEKGFRINKDGSVISTSDKAFKINLDEIMIEKINKKIERVHECKHETAAECKRSLIFDAKLSAPSEWVSVSTGLSHEISNQTFNQHMTHTKHSSELLIRGVINLDKYVTAEENFINDVKNLVNKTIDDNDKKSKLCEIWEKYGHFYARRLILGGAIIKNEKYTKNSGANFTAKFSTYLIYHS
ncbi:hypothetical protein C2G38_809081 [Gigaspora rosea]|uniref:MACPF-like domain-containing protein n=1 Tax=Gigaspora rosea TaxID=44941 RepID=A0A397VME7_9GLOM|nr:hypothetical protein C2G38_809081 [Gigaspora rosea]